MSQLEAERKIKLKPFKNRDIKLILVGNSNAGKSTLIHWLKTKKVDKKIATTHWLKFERWLATMNRKTFNIRAFDFGGQEYYHDTHYLFFTNRTAYVLLWEGDTNRFDDIEVDQRQDDGNVTRTKIQTFSLAYWLDSIKYHTQRRRISQIEKSVEKLLDERDASITQSVKVGEDWTKHVLASTEKIKSELDGEENILVTQNKIDTRTDKIFIDESSFKKDYPKIFDFSEISVFKTSGLESFQKLLFEIFNNLEVVTQEYLGTWGHLKQIIETAKFSNPLNLSEFKDYCNKAILQMPELRGKEKKEIQSILFNEQDTQVFAEFLSDIGVCLFYPDNPVLKSKMFLNQTEILDNIYKALNGLNVLDGEFTESKIAGALEKSISSDDVTTTIELMIHFKILFKHPSKKKTFIAPLYLPKDPPQGVKIFQSLFKKPIYRYRYKTYIQKNIVLDFFHHFGKKALKETNNDALYYYWRDGIIIRDDNSGEIVMVKFVSGNHDQQCAYLELYQIKDTTEEKFLNEVVSYFDEINQGLSVTKLVPAKGKDYVPIDIILENEKEGNWIFHYEQKYFKLTDFKKYLKTPIKMKKIFISYSKQDLGLVNKFIEHLSALQLDGKVAHWYCSELEAGSKWNDEIQKHLDESDIICFMISPNFMKTEYIHEHEVSRAFDRKKKDANFKIVPIILDFCRWTTTKNNLAEFTALPYTAKPVKDFNNQNMAWYIIEENLRLMIESDLDPKGDDFYSQQKLPSDVLKLLTRIIDGKVENNAI